MAYADGLTITVSPTITAGAYSALDVVGGLLTFSLAGFTSNSGLVVSAKVDDDDGENAALVLHLFETLPTTVADNAAFSGVTFANQIGIFSKASFAAADYTAVGANSYNLVTDLNDAFNTTLGNLYGYLVCTATPTYTATTDIKVTIRVVPFVN